MTAGSGRSSAFSVPGTNSRGPALLFHPPLSSYSEPRANIDQESSPAKRDPIDAFASDCGIKFTRVLWRLHSPDPKSGCTDWDGAQEERVKLTEILVDILKEFRSYPGRTGHVQHGRKDGLALLADECVEVTNMLLRRLREAGFPENPSRKRDVWKKALPMTFKSSVIDAISSRLNAFRDHFNFHLLVSLR